MTPARLLTRVTAARRGTPLTSAAISVNPSFGWVRRSAHGGNGGSAPKGGIVVTGQVGRAAPCRKVRGGRAREGPGEDSCGQLLCAACRTGRGGRAESAHAALRLRQWCRAGGSRVIWIHVLPDTPALTRVPPRNAQRPTCRSAAGGRADEARRLESACAVMVSSFLREVENPVTALPPTVGRIRTRRLRGRRDHLG